MKITVRNLQKEVTVNLLKIKKKACLIPQPKRFKNLNLCLYFITNNQIRSLKNEFFQIDEFTDVIAFNITQNYAEVFIAPETVNSNAKEYGVSFEEELTRCVIHGILHIFGWRDDTTKEQKKMWAAQENTLKKTL